MSFPNLRLYLVAEGSNPPETESLGLYQKNKKPSCYMTTDNRLFSNFFRISRRLIHAGIRVPALKEKLKTFISQQKTGFVKLAQFLNI